jgi:hypothetical protein
MLQLDVVIYRCASWRRDESARTTLAENENITESALVNIARVTTDSELAAERFPQGQ